MSMSEYMINVLASVIAVEYMEHGFKKKYEGFKRRIFFAAGCGVYFLALTGINQLS